MIPFASIIPSLTDVQNWMSTWGYFALFGLLFSCGVGVPLPEDIPLLLAGYFIANGKMHLVWASVAAWLGIVGGDCVLYAFGRRYGRNITRVPFIGTHVTVARLEQAELLFSKWGIWVVAVGRLFAGIRGAMVVSAGTTRFSFVKFVIADGLAALVSGGLFVALGHWVGQKTGDLNELAEEIKRYEHFVIVGLVIAAICGLVYFLWRKKTHKPLAQVVIEKVEEKTLRLEQEKERKTTVPGEEVKSV